MQSMVWKQTASPGNKKNSGPVVSKEVYADNLPGHERTHHKFISVKKMRLSTVIPIAKLFGKITE